MNSMTPQFRSLVTHADVSQRMLHARDAAIAGDTKLMLEWLDSVRIHYADFVGELTKMCQCLQEIKP